MAAASPVRYLAACEGAMSAVEREMRFGCVIIKGKFLPLFGASVEWEWDTTF